MLSKARAKLAYVLTGACPGHQESRATKWRNKAYHNWRVCKGCRNDHCRGSRNARAREEKLSVGDDVRVTTGRRLYAARQKIPNS